MTVRQTRPVRHLALRVALIAWVGWATAQPVFAGDNTAETVRVRSSDASLAALIDRATAHAATFQRLVATIRRSNGMVHVEAGTCGHAVRACLQMWMETVGSNRFLRIAIDRKKSDADVDVMGSIGHELQHAVEAPSEPGVINSTSLYFFFKRLAPTDNQVRFETAAAIRAGKDIRNELRRR